MTPGDEHVIVVLEYLNVVVNLKTLESFFDDGTKIDHPFLFVFVEVLRIRNGEVVVQMERETVFLSP